MKSTLLALSLLFSFTTSAQDISRTEKWEDSHRDLPDGSTEYIGACSTHQDYEGKLFKVTKTIVKYFEPEYNAPAQNTMRKLAKVEAELLEATADIDNYNDMAEFFSSVDDITLEKIEHKKIKGLDLYRWNIGVGGGNGYYEVFNRSVVNGKVKYEKMSHVFDRDIEFCDSKVWLKN